MTRYIQINLQSPVIVRFFSRTFHRIAITFQEHAFQVGNPFPESLPDDPENVTGHISTCQDDHFRDSNLGTTLSTGSWTCRRHVGGVSNPIG